MRRTLFALKKTIKQQRAAVETLKADLRRRNIIIGELDSMVNGLNRNVEVLNEQAEQQRQELAEQEARLNSVRYCIGTVRDLKDMNILKSGRIQADKANENYFTKADLRELNEILTHSDEVKILTLHPESSYSLVKDENGNIIIKIKDKSIFWSSSKLLVIQVD